MVALAVLGLRLLVSGKLGAAWDALWSPPPASADALPTGGGGTSRIAPASSSYPNSTLFLDVKPSDYHRGDLEVSGVAAADAAGLSAYGARLYADWDYAVPSGSNVYLPGGRDVYYKVLPSWKDGRTVVVQVLRGPAAAIGGVIEFLHLSADYLTGKAGQIVQGGTLIGQSGYPSGANEYGSGDHLAVIADPRAGQWLQGGAHG